MVGLIEDYKAKNFELNIKSNLYSVNHGLDFDTFLDTRQAIGAENLVSIIKDLDGECLTDWEIYGWYGDYGFGDDFNGEMKDGTSFFNETYFENEWRMDILWKKIPCLRLRTGYSMGDIPPKVYLSMSMAPYERENIMDPVEFTNVFIENEDCGIFSGANAVIKIVDEEYRHRINDECSLPNVLIFKMPQTYCVRVRYIDATKDSWVFIHQHDVDEMRERLSDMRREDREE